MPFETFNDYANYDKQVYFSYNIIEKLFENENIWRLIAYDEPDALNPSTKSNLTTAEKKALIYRGEEDSSLFRVFQQPSTDDAFSNENTQLRVYPSITDPYKRTLAYVDIAFEILTHSKINTLENTTTRIDNLLSEILGTLNGKDINGVGNLFFDKSARSSNSARLRLNNNKNYFGFILIMTTNVG